MYCLETQWFVGGTRVASQNEWIPNYRLHTDTDSPFQPAVRWESHEAIRGEYALTTW